MNDNTRNTFASYGLEILKRCVLLVLYDARDEGIIPQREIRERLGITRVNSSAGNWNSLFYGILSYLQVDGYAHHEVGYGWKITEDGVSLIEKSPMQ